MSSSAEHSSFSAPPACRYTIKISPRSRIFQRSIAALLPCRLMPYRLTHSYARTCLIMAALGQPSIPSFILPDTQTSKLILMRQVYPPSHRSGSHENMNNRPGPSLAPAWLNLILPTSPSFRPDHITRVVVPHTCIISLMLHNRKPICRNTGIVFKSSECCTRLTVPRVIQFAGRYSLPHAAPRKVLAGLVRLLQE